MENIKISVDHEEIWSLIQLIKQNKINKFYSYEHINKETMNKLKNCFNSNNASLLWKE